MIGLNPVQEWIATLDRRRYALTVGLLIGIIGTTIGLLIALTNPLIAAGIIFGLLIGLFVMSNIQLALYGALAVVFLLPFGALPFRLVFTPSFLDAALGAFLFLYLCQWMNGTRRTLSLTPVHIVILCYMGWLLLSFVLGLRWASPSSTVLRGFAETLLAISLTFVLVDFISDAAALRRIVLVLMVLAGVQALAAIVLYALNDGTAEALLVRLGRIGYPDGGVIRYIEDTAALGERAIGTWVDPNVLGGVMAISAAAIAPQVFAEKRVLRSRIVTLLILGLIGTALFLTYSRAAILALCAGLVFIGLLRYRTFLAILAVVVALVLVMPFTQPLVERFVDAFTAGDLATQMRLGEYSDALRLIGRYPVFGVGFTGTPDIDLYTDVASMYLLMANQIGLVGVAIFLTLVLAVFAYGLSAWRRVRENASINAIFLGYHAGLLTVLLNSVADLYFFRLDFQAAITFLWITMALALASARVARQTTVENGVSFQ